MSASATQGGHKRALGKWDILSSCTKHPRQFSSRFWATVCKTVRPVLLVRCLSVLSCQSVLSATFVHCGQTVGRIKMKLGMQVCLGPGHIELEGDPASPPPNRHSLPIFGPYLLRTNGCMDQDVTWYGARPRPWLPLPKSGTEPAIFCPFLLWPNGWMHQSATWYGGRPQPRVLWVRWGPSPPPPKREAEAGAEAPNFRPMAIVAERLDGSRWHLAWR